MHAFLEDAPPPAGSLLPPATTQRRYALPTTLTGEPRIIPPFVARPNVEPKRQEVEPKRQETAEQEPEPLLVAPAAEIPAEPEPVAQDAAPEDEIEDTRWESMPDEGVVEPAFEADTDAVLEALTHQAAELARRDDFPLEAFIVPEQAQRVPSGMEGKSASAAPEHTPLGSLAERLEKLSHRLRVEDTDTVVRRLAGGDRLDALLAGLLAGYLAGISERQ